MAQSLGDVELDVTVDTSGLDKGLSQAEKTTQTRTSSMSSHIDSMAKTAGIAFVAIGAAAIGAVKSASDLAEATSAVEQVFGQQAKTIPGFSKSVAESFGLTRAEALDAARSIGSMLIPLGHTQTEAATMSTRMLELARDLGSFNNVPTPQFLELIRDGLSGNGDELQKYGINLSAAAVQQEALATTGKASASALTEQELVAARYAILIREAGAANGDFARTSDGLANQQRILKAEIGDLAAEMGAALLPAAKSVVGALRDGIGWLKEHAAQVRVVIGLAAGLAAGLIALSAAMKVVSAVSTAMSWNPWVRGLALLGLVVSAFVGLKLASQDAKSAAEVYSDALKLEADQHQAVADAARAQKQALDDLKGANIDAREAELDLRDARRALNQVTKEAGPAATRTAAERDRVSRATIALERAEQRLRDATTRQQDAARQTIKTLKDKTTALNAEDRQTLATFRTTEKQLQQARQGILLNRSSRAARAALTNAEKNHQRSVDAVSRVYRVQEGRLRNLSRQAREQAAQITANDSVSRRHKATLLEMARSFDADAAAVGRMNDKLGTVPARFAGISGSARDTAAALQGLISPIQSVIDAIARIPSSKTITIRSVILTPTKTRSKRVGEDAGKDIAEGAVSELKRAQPTVARALSQGVIDAVREAKQNLRSLGDSFAGLVGQVIDARAEKRIAALGNTAEAIRLRAIEAQQAQEEQTRTWARLQKDLAEATAEGDAEKIADAQQAIADQALADEEAAIRTSLEQRADAIQAEEDLRKKQAEDQVQALTDAYARGTITAAQANEQILAVLGTYGVSYEAAGSLLGQSFANGFADALQALQAQIEALRGGPQAPGTTGAEPTVSDPFTAQMNEWEERRQNLVRELGQARRDAREPGGPGKAQTTAAEQKRIDKWAGLLKAHMAAKPKRMAVGGILRSPTLTLAAERGVPEAFISLDGSMRSWGLLDQAAAMMPRLPPLPAPAQGRGGVTGPLVKIGEQHLHYEADERAVAARMGRSVWRELVSR